jgi:hypothetical protein
LKRRRVLASKLLLSVTPIAWLLRSGNLDFGSPSVRERRRPWLLIAKLPFARIESVLKGILFANRVILIDTGMNQAAYGGLPSALVISPKGELDVLNASPAGGR